MKERSDVRARLGRNKKELKAKDDIDHHTFICRNKKELKADLEKILNNLKKSK